ncbi:peptidoglycan synthetase FtsI [Antricoccus suffuscus]|uniref:Peptidoglycan synthetase FtsI n=1 Tax=Antricoccus suffuscus TaxID=1629062 RepID=A0A2T0ZYH4_9ACTN|nr:penicillin-binding protein 2 [Antricoccus suffuscus]PRZ41409.1 peptidoglycan synthetase FtsI [Antricoccus suffuscus]
MTDRRRTGPPSRRTPPPSRGQRRRPQPPRAPQRRARSAAGAAPRRRKKIRLGSQSRRMNAALGFLCALLVVIGGRLFQLQWIDGAAYAAQGDNLRKTTVQAARGEILDAQGRRLAYSVESRRVVADPTLISEKDRPAVAELLSTKLKIPYSQALLGVMASGRYSIIARQVDPTVADSIMGSTVNGKTIAGIFTERTQKRVYPATTTGSQVIGFTGQDGTGLAGIELSMNKLLTGTDGQMVYEASPSGAIIPAGIQKMTPAKSGDKVTLTINADLQYLTQNAVEAYQVSSGATAAQAVVLDAKTGQVVAMASTPGYNSADPGASDPGTLSNPAISDVIEPGSINKITTFGPALQEGLITPKTVITVPGQIKIADKVVHDAWVHGDVKYTATGILAKSSNVGTLMINEKLNKNDFYNYLLKYGLGSKTGIELPGESGGILAPPSKWSGSQAGNIPIGQGISMTVLQMAGMYQAIANNGVYIQPRVIKSITDADGNALPTSKPKSTQVVSEQTATTLRSMLEAVTGPGGTAKSANVPGYRVAGKTGTGQRPNPACNCYAGGGYNHTFVGMAPMNDPKYVVAIALTDPHVAVKGGAAPLFSTIMGQLLQSTGVPPSPTPSPEYQLTAD